MQAQMTRRGFVAAAAALGVMTCSGISQVAWADQAAQSCDVLVIGGGISGALAALSARAEGADVVLVEKQAMIGGSASLSSGFMVTVNNDHFDEAIDDSWEKMESVLHAVHDQAPDTTYPTWDRLASTFAQQSATIDFMVDLGMTAEFGEKSTAVTMWDGKGAGMMLALGDAMEAKGVRVMLESPAREIVVDENGAVCGAVIEAKDGSQTTIGAKKVILACGGASHNPEILTHYMPTYPDVEINNLSAVGNTGDGFVMGEQLGAKFYDSMVFEGGGAAINDDWKAETGVRLSVNDKLGFDAAGKRFMNEAPAGSGASQMQTYYMVENGSPSYYYLFDSTVDAEVKEAFEAGVEMGAVWFGETIEDLAQQLGIDPAVLSDTFTAYQEACAAGNDAEFGKAADKLVAYADEGGYYAVHYRPSIWGTIGGIVTDEYGHAYGANDDLIENLFAVGEMSNREFYSTFYVGGNSLALNSTMGRIAGAAAVSEL